MKKGRKPQSKPQPRPQPKPRREPLTILQAFLGLLRILWRTVVFLWRTVVFLFKLGVLLFVAYAIIAWVDVFYTIFW